VLPPRGPRRTVLRADDGVRIEAAYDPWASSGDPDSSESVAPMPPAIVLAHGFSGAMDRPGLRRAARVFAQHAAVITFSFRGHGRSSGHSTVGDREVLDLAAAVRWARPLGHGHITTVGFSMGGSVVVRHGALYRPYGIEDTGPRPYGDNSTQPGARRGRTDARVNAGARGGRGQVDADAHSAPRRGQGAGPAGDPAHADAIVTVSAPARWYYRGTAPMRRLHWVIQRPVGRLVSRYGLRTRVHPHGWGPEPLSPVEAAPAITPTPLLIVHGDQDPYFPLDHPRSLAAAADPARTWLWVEPGFGHAENAAEPRLTHRIGMWSTTRYGEARAAGDDGTRATES
jgi:pimeloyl-ACP methyl ester carboxylesterase